MVYDLTESIVTIFKQLRDLQDFGEATQQNDYSDTQLIKFTIQIIRTKVNFGMILGGGMRKYKLIRHG